MPEQYVEAILKYLAQRHYQPLKPRQLARVMGVAEQEYDSFRDAVKTLRDQGRVVLGAKNALMLPEMSSRIVGYYRANPRGFGFITPETPTAHGDLFVPPGKSGGALDGDLVVARVHQQGRREGKAVFAGEIVEIVQRGRNRFVGTLEQTGKAWFVLPEGKRTVPPVVVRDIGAAGPKAGTKVVVEVLDFGGEGSLPSGVIVETLGAATDLAVETLAVIRAHGLSDRFPQEALDEAHRVAEAFDPADPVQRGRREDLTGKTILTIDPPDARDFDDAISLDVHRDGTVTLGVHIADVSSFVSEGGPLDAEARLRTTSVYFPRKVIPMLPESLSNGVCSLQEGVDRFCQSVFITYDAKGGVTGSRVCESVIRSARRLTYVEAQGIIDGQTGGYDPPVVKLLQRLAALAKAIEARRRGQGMLHLDLPDVELVFDESDKVVDAVPEDQSYTHTLIEMFMVEANEAVAALLTAKNRPFLRRIHPPPNEMGSKQFQTFVRACGHRIPGDLTRHDVQALLASVKGRPESYAVNLAILKMMQQAEYSPMQVEHFALASRHYCHFTSPIRRYPDLTVHRLIREYCRNRLDHRPPEDMAALTSLGGHCSTNERRAEAAANELRDVLILQLLETKVGETFDGVITGVANFGIFVESPRFLIEGLVRIDDLGDDWWEVEARTGQVRGQRSGRTFRIGDMLAVRIVNVDVAKRQLYLIPDKPPGKGKDKEPKQPKGKAKGPTKGQAKPAKGKAKGPAKGPAKAPPTGREKTPDKGTRRRKR